MTRLFTVRSSGTTSLSAEMLEVSGTDEGDLRRRTAEKREQLLRNPFGKGGYVVVCRFCEPRAALVYERDQRERGGQP